MLPTFENTPNLFFPILLHDFTYLVNGINTYRMQTLLF